MDIIQDFIPVGHGNRPGRANPTKLVTIHNSGNPAKGAGAYNHAEYLKSSAAESQPVSWHYTVDEKNVYQHLPDNEDAFHAGDGSGDGNRKSIGIEICMNSDGDLLKATDKAVELVALLCKRHNIPIGNIVQHNHWTGKDCPQMIRNGKPYNWDMFISKIKKMLSASGSAPTPAPTPTPAPKSLPFQSYTVKVIADELNIRKGPGTNFAINGSIKDNGVYTIVEESNGTGATKWGKLKSGVGWISLDFTKKLK